MKNNPLLLFIFLFFTSNFSFGQVSSEINWLSFSEAVKLQKETPKKMLIYVVFTECPDCGKNLSSSNTVKTIVMGSCSWCKMMDKRTWSDSEIIAFANANFYMVKLDASSEEEILFNGHTFTSQKIPNPENKKMALSRMHTLAYSLTEGSTNFPTTVFMNEKMERIMLRSGLIYTHELTKMMHYVKDEKYKVISYEDYKKQ